MAMQLSAFEETPVPEPVSKVSEQVITDALNSKYIGNCRYRLANAYIFARDWESDFFVQKDNGYCYEFEVKISRADFFNDKKKVDKHSILATGTYRKRGHGIYNPNSTGIDDRYIYEYENKEHKRRPNKFFYVVPEGLVKIEEVPAYAGLMYYKGVGCIDTMKEAPFIHKEKLDLENVLCTKFYHYWLDAKHRIRELETDMKYLKRSLNK